MEEYAQELYFLFERGLLRDFATTVTVSFSNAALCEAMRRLRLLSITSKIIVCPRPNPADTTQYN